MATKKTEPETPAAEVDPLDAVTDIDVNDLPKHRRRPVSPRVLKLRELVDAAAAAGKPKAILLKEDQVADYASALRRAGKIDGMPEVEVSYRYDTIKGVFAFGPKSLFPTKAGK